MKELVAAVLAFCCGLFASSCVQGHESSIESGEAQGSSGGEPVGEDREPLPIVHFDPSEFPFVTTVPDDGEGDGGGWQVANATLDFWHVVIPRLPRRWKCSLAVEMPLRTKLMGPVPPSRAATLSLEIAEAVARVMDYDLPTATFCPQFVTGMQQMFMCKYPRLGARVLKR